jgi:hypothetical protein
MRRKTIEELVTNYDRKRIEQNTTERRRED